MNIVKEIFRGILIGIANIIPGVSGGTMMVSMGIYDKIIGSITNLFRSFISSIKTLLPYGVGMGIGIIGLSFFIEQFFIKYPFQTAMTFVGLIFGGVPVIFKKVKGKKVDFISIILFIIFFSVIIIMEFLGKNKSDIQLELNILVIIRLLIVGIIAAATMVIPGVSGSMILLILGYYNPILALVNSTIQALRVFDFTTLIHNGILLAPFVIGVFIGIFAVAKLIEYLLRSFELRTYYSILGLIISSPFAVMSGISIRKLNSLVLITGIFTFSIGFLIAFCLGKGKKE